MPNNITPVTTRTKRSRLHWLLRSSIFGITAGAVSLTFFNGIAQPLLKFEATYWATGRPLDPRRFYLQQEAFHWAITQPISFAAWLGSLAVAAAIGTFVYGWETWASRPMDSSKPLN